MSKENNLQDFITDIANAIRYKKGTTDLIKVQDFSDEIRNLNTSENENLPFKDVNFYDYNGDILYSYTWDEFVEYNQLPPLPTHHEGLTCYMWNYTLEEVLEQGGRCDVGALYESTDGNTHIFLTSEYKSGKKVTLNGFVGGSTGGLVDWGDGTVESYKSNITHTYGLIGRAEIVVYNCRVEAYSISTKISYITSQDVEEVWFGIFNKTAGAHNFGMDNFIRCYAKYIILPKTPSTDYYGAGFVWAPNLRHINLYVNQGRYPLNLNCPNIKSISLNYKPYSSSITAPMGLDEVTFYNCIKLERFHFPTMCGYNRIDYTSAPTTIIYPHESIRALSEISVSAASTMLQASDNILFFIDAPTTALLMCRTSIIQLRPNSYYSSNVSNISSGGCRGILDKVLWMKYTFIDAFSFFGSDRIVLDYRDCTSVKLLSTAQAFDGCNSFNIVVPDSLYDSWIVATNWSAVASNIIKASNYSD